MKKIILGCLSGFILSQAAFATHGAFYVGTNASRSLFHITQQIVMDPKKVIDPLPYDRDWGQRKDVFNAELIAGVKASNGSVFGAFEAWYNPSSITVASSSEDIVFNTGISNRWGARILAGVQHKEMTIYGIFGLGNTTLTNDTSFPSEGTYGPLPGVSLASTNASATEVTLTAGIGMSVVFTKDFDISVEYQHQSADNLVNLYDNFITYFNSIGNQTTHMTADILNVGLKYHFKPFVF